MSSISAQQVRAGVVDGAGELDLLGGQVAARGCRPAAATAAAASSAGCAARGSCWPGTPTCTGRARRAAAPSPRRRAGPLDLHVLDLDVAVLLARAAAPSPPARRSCAAAPRSWSCSSPARPWDWASSSSVRRLAWIVLIATPMVTTSRSRNVRCSSENGVTAANSMTPSASALEQHRQHDHGRSAASRRARTGSAGSRPARRPRAPGRPRVPATCPTSPSPSRNDRPSVVRGPRHSPYERAIRSRVLAPSSGGRPGRTPRPAPPPAA